MSDEQITVKHAGGRPKKELIYKTEQEELFKKLLNFLNINDNNKTFYPEDISSDPEKVKNIIDLRNDCKKYFNSASWSIFNKKPPTNVWLSLTSSVMKSMKYKMTLIINETKTDIVIRKKGYIISKLP
jgi:hypothetical protein